MSQSNTLLHDSHEDVNTITNDSKANLHKQIEHHSGQVEETTNLLKTEKKRSKYKPINYYSTINEAVGLEEQQEEEEHLEQEIVMNTDLLSTRVKARAIRQEQEQQEQEESINKRTITITKTATKLEGGQREIIKMSETNELDCHDDVNVNIINNNNNYDNDAIVELEQYAFGDIGDDDDDDKEKDNNCLVDLNYYNSLPQQHKEEKEEEKYQESEEENEQNILLNLTYSKYKSLYSTNPITSYELLASSSFNTNTNQELLKTKQLEQQQLSLQKQQKRQEIKEWLISIKELRELRYIMNELLNKLLDEWIGVCGEEEQVDLEMRLVEVELEQMAANIISRDNYYNDDYVGDNNNYYHPYLEDEPIVANNNVLEKRKEEEEYHVCKIECNNENNVNNDDDDEELHEEYARGEEHHEQQRYEHELQQEEQLEEEERLEQQWQYLKHEYEHEHEHYHEDEQYHEDEDEHEQQLIELLQQSAELTYKHHEQLHLELNTLQSDINHINQEHNTLTTQEQSTINQLNEIQERYNTEILSHARIAKEMQEYIDSLEKHINKLETHNSIIETEMIDKELLPTLAEELFNSTYVKLQCINRKFIFGQLNKYKSSSSQTISNSCNNQNNHKSISWEDENKCCLELVENWCRELIVIHHASERQECSQQITTINSRSNIFTPQHIYETIQHDGDLYHRLCEELSTQELFKEMFECNSFSNHEQLFTYENNADAIMQSVYEKLHEAAGVYFGVKLYFSSTTTCMCVDDTGTNLSKETSTENIYTIKRLSELIDMNSYHNIKVKEELFSYRQEYQPFICSFFYALVGKVRNALLDTNGEEIGEYKSDEHVVLLKGLLVRFIKGNNLCEQRQNNYKDMAAVRFDVEEIVDKLVRK